MNAVYALENQKLLFEYVLGESIQKRMKTWGAVNRTMILNHCSEFVFHIREKNETYVLSERNCRLREVKQEEERLIFCYEDQQNRILVRRLTVMMERRSIRGLH